MHDSDDMLNWIFRTNTVLFPAYDIWLSALVVCRTFMLYIFHVYIVFMGVGRPANVVDVINLSTSRFTV